MPAAIVAALSGCCVVDWQYARKLLRRLQATSKRDCLIILGLSVGWALIGGAFVALSKLIDRLGLTYIFGAILAGSFAVLCLYVLIHAVREIMAWQRECRRVRAISLSDSLPRSEIARIFESLSFTNSRLRFVGELSKRQVRATGAWPPAFQLATSDDTSMTELAKLEEQWLGLDR